MFAGHVVVAVFAEPDSPLLGLRNLVMPLRASNIPYTDLRHVIILGNKEWLSREWPLLRNLPKVSMMEGSPMNRADLRAAKVNFCRTCIVLSAKVRSDIRVQGKASQSRAGRCDPPPTEPAAVHQQLVWRLCSALL